ncbi:MAG TPA: DUF2971 domain-containing protein [Thermoanaerobaculia bacterium]|jgi:hypothetical protein|nr:DUF2971 domain-containing protein [Thermoanaerobaculia bacterium]
MPKYDDPLLQEFYDDLKAERTPSGKPPHLLYHYTTAAGLLGIIESQSVRATNYSFLNDSSEIKYGRALVEDCIAARAAKCKGFPHQVLDSIKNLHEFLPDIYVACFTALKDDLAQWRGYGIGVERYCLGFHSRHVHQATMDNDHSRFAAVIYDEKEQRKRIDAVLDRAVNFLEKKKHPQPAEPGRVLAHHLARRVPTFKSPAYKGEGEWRVIISIHDDAIPAVSFDTSRGVLRPFIPVRMADPIPLSSLHILAPARKEAAMKAATLMLRCRNILGVQPEESTIPYAD